MKTAILSLATIITVFQFSLPIEAAPMQKNNGFDTAKAADILLFVARKKTRQQRVDACIGRAKDVFDATIEACANSLPDKKGSRQTCYDLAGMQFAGTVANCNNIQ